MARRVHLSKNLYLDIEVGIAQLVSVVIVAVFMFVVPVAVYNNAKTSSQTSEGQVLGTLTRNELLLQQEQAQSQQGYITLPLLNLKFDPSFRDPSSLPIAIGITSGVVSFVTLLVIVMSRRGA